MPSVPRTERPPRGASFIWPYSRQGQPAAIVHFGPFAFGAVQYALSSPCRARIGRNERFSCGRLAGNRSLGRFPAGGPLIGANLSQVWRECRALNGHRGVASFIWPHSRHSKRAHHPPVSHYERGRAIRVPARANRSSPLRGGMSLKHTPIRIAKHETYLLAQRPVAFRDAGLPQVRVTISTRKETLANGKSLLRCGVGNSGDKRGRTGDLLYGRVIQKRASIRNAKHDTLFTEHGYAPFEPPKRDTCSRRAQRAHPHTPRAPTASRCRSWGTSRGSAGSTCSGHPTGRPLTAR